MTDYSRGDYADLPAGTTDLENNYTAPDLTAIASNDNSTYAEQTANNEIAIHQYKKTVAGQYTNITWSGKSSLAPSESPVIMEVYNVTGTPAWEELDRDDSTAADTDFDIIYNNLATADYLDSGVITWRVWQAASAGPLTFGRTDITGASEIVDNTLGCVYAVKAPTLPGTGTLQSVSLYCKNSNINEFAALSVALYSDNSGTPDALLAQSASPVTVGDAYAWVTVPISYSLVSGTQYWFAFISGSFGAAFYGNTTDGVGTKRDSNNSTFQNPFSVVTTYATWNTCCYATYLG